MARCISFLLLLLAVQPLAGDEGLYQIVADARIDPARVPLAGKALVYVLHPRQGTGIGVIPIAFAKTSVFLDGKLLGIMVGGNHGTYFAADVEPGRHEFAASGENVSLIDADLAPDRIYLVEIASRAGMIKARAFIGPVPPDSKAARRILKATVWADVREIRTTEAGRTWMAGHQEEILRSIERARASRGDVMQIRPEDGFSAPPWSR